MIYGSVCSGIEAVTLAWEPLGFRPAWFAEIDPFCSALLAHRFPNVPNLGDFTTINGDASPIDILAGGTPCQSFSIAGRRGGLDDDRGNLALEFCRLAGRFRPRWIVWENVPGVLSSNGGRDFGTILGALAQLGYGCAWRVLDARFFGVPQRRRRVFVVGHLGDWRRAAAVLLEREGLRGHPAARRAAWKGSSYATAPSLTGSGRGVARTGESRGQDPVIAMSLNAKGGSGRLDGESETFVATAFSAKDHGADAGPLAPTLRAMPHDRSHANAGGQVAVCFESRVARNGRGGPSGLVPPLKAQSGGTGRGDGAPLLAVSGSPRSCICADAIESDATALLRALRSEVGEEAFAEWRSRIVDSFQSPEVLQSALHGCGVRRAACEAGAWMDDGTLPRAEDLPEGTLRSLWQGGPDGCSPQGRELVQQLARELGKALPELPLKGASSVCAVRRLTPREAERLQGMPDDWTLIPYRGKPAADGPRYRAIGNAMAVPVMEWIARRMQIVDGIRG